MGTKGNVVPCLSCPKEARDELWAVEKSKKTKESGAIQRVMQDEGFRELEGQLHVIGGAKGRKVTWRGPIDLFTQLESTEAKEWKQKLKQAIIREACDNMKRENNRSELERIDKERQVDFLNMLKGFVVNQVGYTEKIANVWTKVVEETRGYVDEST
ncbi:hypothetical protein ACSQ67_017510 [Phaseolus vulgaris]